LRNCWQCLKIPPMPETELKELSAPINVDPEIEEMFRAGLHLGYSRTRRHPKMKPYIFGLRNNIEVFDLEKVREKLREAEEFLKQLASERGIILIVGSKPSAAPLVEKAGEELGMPYSVRRWPGGFLTNFASLKKRVEHLEDLKEKKSSGELAKYTKKEQLVLGDEIIRLERKFYGLTSLKKLPDVMLIIDPGEEKTATTEARKIGLKTVGIMNLDCDPGFVSYPIPANDSAHSSIKYVLDRLVAAYKSGAQIAPELAEKKESETKKEKDA